MKRITQWVVAAIRTTDPYLNKVLPRDKAWANIARRLLVEFSLPFIVSVVWAVISYRTAASGANVAMTVGTAFGTAFLFVGYLTNHIFRVAKQQGVDSKFSVLENRVTRLIDTLEERTDDILGNIHGGDSYCYLWVSDSSSTVVLRGEHPMFDVTISIDDIDARDRSEAHPLQFIKYRSTSTFPFLRSSLGGHLVDLSNRQSYRASVSISSRNGKLQQYIRMRKDHSADVWYFATRVYRGGKLLFKHIDWEPELMEDLESDPTWVGWDD